MSEQQEVKAESVMTEDIMGSDIQDQAIKVDLSSKRNRGFLFFSLIQVMMLFIPTMETEMFRRSVFDVVKKLFVSIARFDFAGIIRFYSEDVGIDDVRTLILLGILVIGLIAMIMTFVALIQLIRRNAKGFLKLIRINQVFYMILAFAGIGVSVITIMGYLNDSSAELFQIIYSLVPIILLICFNLVITIITLIRGIRVNKESFNINVKGFFKHITVIGTLTSLLIMGVVVLLLLTSSSLKMAYTYSGQYVERIVATYHNNGDIEVVRVVFLEDGDDYDIYEEDYDNEVDDNEDWLDELDVSVDWDLKHGLFNRMTIIVNWEGVDENDEFYDGVFRYGFFGYNKFLYSTVAMYELTDDLLDDEYFERGFMESANRIGYTKAVERSDYKSLEGMMYVSSFADYSVFESDLPLYEIPFGSESTYMEISRKVIASDLPIDLIIED